MPGPAKAPRNLKVIAGTDRPCRRDDSEAAAPEFERVEEFPAPPQHLTTDGSAMWAALGPQLVACGLLQVVDLYALEQLCYAWQQFRAKAKAGFEVTASENTALTNLWAQFGLTPAARRKVAAGLVDKKANAFASNGKRTA